MLHNLSDIDFVLSSSSKVKCDNVIRLATYGLLVFNSSNIWPILAPLRDINFHTILHTAFQVLLNWLLAERQGPWGSYFVCF